MAVRFRRVDGGFETVETTDVAKGGGAIWRIETPFGLVDDTGVRWASDRPGTAEPTNTAGEDTAES